MPIYKCKASKSPIICAWLAEVCYDFDEVATPQLKEHTTRMSIATWGMATYFSLVKIKVNFYNDAQASLMSKAGDVFFFHYSAGARVWRDMKPGTGMYPCAPKLHQMHHLVLDAVHERENPSRFHCFGPEDRVGKSLILAAAAHPFQVVVNSMQKYRASLIDDWAKL